MELALILQVMSNVLEFVSVISLEDICKKFLFAAECESVFLKEYGIALGPDGCRRDCVCPKPGI